MGTGTSTTTFTKADIRKVIANFAADFGMIGQSTGLWTRSQIDATVADLNCFAEAGFLTAVVVILYDAQGKVVKPRRYLVSESAVGWASDRPGDNLWPYTPNGKLELVATLSDAWWQMDEVARRQRKTAIGVVGDWGYTSTDTSFSTMTATQDRRYASNGYGLQRISYS
jgi:hypothetical protein